MNPDPVQASDELDERLAVEIKAQRRYSRTTRVLLYLTAALAVFGVWVAVRVDRNSREIDRTQAAIRVYCDQTNRHNAEARAKFIDQFAEQGPNPKLLIQFADVAWPQRDCAQVSTVSDPSPSTTSIKEPSP